MRPSRRARKSPSVPQPGVEDALRALLTAMPTPAQAKTEEPLAYTIEEAADQLRISRAGMFRLMKSGEIVPSKISARCVRVPREELVRYLRSKQTAA